VYVTYVLSNQNYPTVKFWPVLKTDVCYTCYTVVLVCYTASRQFSLTPSFTPWKVVSSLIELSTASYKKYYWHFKYAYSNGKCQYKMVGIT